MFAVKLFFSLQTQTKTEPFSRSEHSSPFMSGVSVGDANCFHQDATIRLSTFLMLAVKCLAISSYFRVNNVSVSSLCATLHTIY